MLSNATPIDYVQNFATQEEMVEQLARQKNHKDTMEVVLDELKVPLFVAILFFVFQSRSFKKTLLSKVPSLFNESGGFSQNGFIVVSAFFGLSYYTSLKLIRHFSL